MKTSISATWYRRRPSGWDSKVNKYRISFWREIESMNKLADRSVGRYWKLCGRIFLSFSNVIQCFRLIPKCSCCLCHFDQSRSIGIRTSFRHSMINIRKWLSFSTKKKRAIHWTRTICQVLAWLDYKMDSLPCFFFRWRTKWISAITIRPISMRFVRVCFFLSCLFFPLISSSYVHMP